MMTRGGPAAALATTVLAPISWGTTYLVITELLPAERPLLVAAARVVPAGLLLVAIGRLVSRWRPRGGEWGRTALLAAFNVGAFFPLLAVAVQRLPGGTAAAVGGIVPLLVAGLSRALVGRRPTGRELAVGVVAAAGVALVVVRPGAAVDVPGVLAAVGANVSFATGVVLTKRFPAPANRVAATGWQLLLGGVLLVPLTLVVEGRPPALDGGAAAGFAYLSVVATALAFVLWFNGIRRLPASAPPLLGLAAPITGATLGWIVRGESLVPTQLVGFAVALGAVAVGTSAAGTPSGLAPHRPHRRAVGDVDLADDLDPEPLVQGAAAGARRLEVRRCPVGVGGGQGVGEQRAAEPAALSGR
jgi:probable blue pigment (indigoidine) exporter